MSWLTPTQHAHAPLPMGNGVSQVVHELPDPATAAQVGLERAPGSVDLGDGAHAALHGPRTLHDGDGATLELEAEIETAGQQADAAEEPLDLVELFFHVEVTEGTVILRRHPMADG